MKNTKLLEKTSVLTGTMIKKYLESPEGRCDADFRLKVRKRVKRGLLDLQFLIEVAEKKDVDWVLNEGSLRPVVAALLPSLAEPDRSRAEIAEMFITWGLNYMVSTVGRDNPLVPAVQPEIDKVVGLSYNLVRSIEGG